MAVDFFLLQKCAIRETLGKGDHVRGAQALLAYVKNKNRVAALTELLAKRGESPETVQTQGIVVRSGSAESAPVNFNDTTGGEIESMLHHCDACPANLQKKALGCLGCVNYPIAESTESWVVRQLQEPGTTGAEFCHGMLSDFKITGEIVREMRHRQLFEGAKGIPIVFRKGLFNAIRCNSDQIFQVLLATPGKVYNPDHCFACLLWFGAIQVDGVVPKSPADAAAVETLFTLEIGAQRRDRCKFRWEAPGPDAGKAQFRLLMESFFISWVYGVPLVVDA